MTFAAAALELLGFLKLVPEAVDAVEAWFRVNPDATPEQLAALVAEYRAVSEARKASVAAADAALADDPAN